MKFVNRNILLLSFFWLSSLGQAASIQPLPTTLATQDLIKQLQLLLIADDNEKLNQLKKEYSEISLSSPLPLSVLTSQLAQYWQMDTLNFQSSSLVEQANSLKPEHRFYKVLRERVFYLYQKQRSMQATSQSWSRLSLDRLIKPKESHPMIKDIRHRLFLLGDLKTTSRIGNLYDAELTAAVSSFQQRHGLNVDGIIGRQTLFWLNLSLADRAKLLARNFIRQEQWYKSSGDDYLLVNIPQFQLTLVHAGNQVLTSKVTVGRIYRTTKLIQSEIANLVINPGWNVPYTILRKDLLPKLQKDIHYLSVKNYQVFDQSNQPLLLDKYDMKRVAAGDFPYRVYQKPGPKNPLGNFKLHFDNPYSIYLHDTPQRKQFDLAVRALSSGCVRVEKAQQIARWLAFNRATNQSLWNKAINEGEKTQWLKLSKPMPVYIVYWTAWADEKDLLPHYRQDIYGWETNTDHFAKKWIKPQKHPKLAINSIN